MKLFIHSTSFGSLDGAMDVHLHTFLAFDSCQENVKSLLLSLIAEYMSLWNIAFNFATESGWIDHNQILVLIQKSDSALIRSGVSEAKFH